MTKEIKINSTPGFQPSCIIGKIMVNIGDKISKDDVILSMEGKKGTKDLISEFSGEVMEILVSEGDEVNKGTTAIILKTQGEEIEVEARPCYTEEISGEVVVLGGGPGGYVAAIRASQKGKKVVLIEEDRLGGTCLNKGCIPTKSMVQTIKVAELMEKASIFGLENYEVKLSMDKILKRKNEVVSSLISGIESSMDKYKVKVIYGKGRLESNDTVVVEGDKNYEVKYENLILATGSEVALPNFPGANDDDILTSDDLLELREVPESLIILGGRVIAMEFAFIYNSLGSDVTVIQRSDTIFPNLDSDIVNVVRESAIERGIKLIEGTRVNKITNSYNGGKVINFEHKGEEKIIYADKVAIATGRKPRLENIGVEENGLKISEDTSGINVDLKMRTNNKNIYAIGDVTNIYNLAHVASKQALVAVENILGNHMEMNYNSVPEAIFTNPEIGVVGLNEKDCRDKSIDYIVGKFPYISNGKALVEDDNIGFIKVIADKNTREILGAGLIGNSATELLSVFTNLISKKETIDIAKDVIYAHPTVSETVFESLLDLDNESIHK